MLYMHSDFFGGSWNCIELSNSILGITIQYHSELLSNTCCCICIRSRIYIGVPYLCLFLYFCQGVGSRSLSSITKLSSADSFS